MWLISDYACAWEVKGMSCAAVSIHCSYTCIFMYILCDYFTILKNGCFACEVYWSIHLCLQACSKAVPTLPQESLLIYNLVTTLLQPKNGSQAWQFQGLDNLPTRLSQPCHNHATTLFQPCHHLVARLLQGCDKLATMLSIHGIKMAVE